MMTGYFSSVVPEIQDHVAAFSMCSAAQVYWWLRRRGCLTEDINQLIRHCFTISQHQKVTKSKYMKDLGHAVVDDQDADDIINAAATQGIFDLTLGLSDKEKRTMAIGKIHNASAITFGKAKEGSMEAYNFSSVQSVTSTHSINEKKKAAKTDALVRSLTKFVYSIDTGTSKVTAEDTDEEMEDSEDESSNYSSASAGGRGVAIEGMGILDGTTTEHEMAKNRPDEDRTEKDTGSQASKTTNREEDLQDMSPVKTGVNLARRMYAAEELTDTSGLEEGDNITPINILSSDKDSETYEGGNSSAQSKDEELDIKSYTSSVTEVDSGVFDANHAQRYVDPANFCHALWNEAGPTVGAMKVMLEMMRTEFEGELLGLKADLTHFPKLLVDFLIEESGESLNEAIGFLDQTLVDITQFEEQNNEDMVGNQAATKNEDALPPDKEEGQPEASKTQGTVPRAPEATPAEGIATGVIRTSGDKEGPQSVSMAPGG